MTGNDILKEAAFLMGFETPSEEMNIIGPTVINFVLEDLDKEGIKDLEDEITLSNTLKATVVAGVSMLLSVAIGDLRAKESFSLIYNEKRSKVKRANGKITDSLPKGEEL